jgi:hypothetical protein
MQSSRTREDGRDFDRFDCQTCHTVIELPRPPRDDAQAR